MPEQRRTLSRRPRAAEEYDEPRQRRLHRSDRREEADDDEGAVAPVASGWSGYKRTKANAPSRWATPYKIQDDEQIILFLEDEPYASFLMHWCDWVPRGHKQSYICLQDDCPLDDIQAPTARVRFNILDLQGDTPILAMFECGITVTDTLNKITSGGDPLGGQYFAVSMTGPKKSRRTMIRPVKARALREDWKMDPLTEEEIAKFDSKLWTSDSVERSSRKELQEVADAASE